MAATQPKTPTKAAPYLVDVRALVALGLAAVAAATLIGFYLWMVRPAAAREVAAACNGLRPTQTLEAPAICGGEGKKCTLPMPAPDFEVTTNKGTKAKLSDYRGKVVLLNFWASWCDVCKSEKPSMGGMTSDMASGDFVVLTVSSDADWARVLLSLAISHNEKAVPERFKRRQPPPDVPTMDEAAELYDHAVPGGVPYRVVLDKDSEYGSVGPIGQSWGIKAVPESFLIDRLGRIRYYFVNKRDWNASIAHTCLQSVIDE